MRANFIAVGIGCRRGADPRALEQLVEQVLIEAGVPASDLGALGTITGKENEPAVLSLSARLGLPVTAFSPERLERETPRLLTPSDIVFRETGCHGVAEAAALALAGDKARLVVPKRVGDGCTVAVAVLLTPEDDRHHPQVAP